MRARRPRPGDSLRWVARPMTDSRTCRRRQPDDRARLRAAPSAASGCCSSTRCRTASSSTAASSTRSDEALRRPADGGLARPREARPAVASTELEGMPDDDEGRADAGARCRSASASARRVDIELDRRIGFFPLAVRHSIRHGFHEGRWSSGPPQLLARSRPCRPAAALGVPRPADGALVLLARTATCRRRCSSACAPSARPRRHQPPGARVDAAHARRASSRAAGVGYVASWDHPVGKGVVSPRPRPLRRPDRRSMRDDLERYHGIEPVARRRHRLAADRRLPPAAHGRRVRGAARSPRTRSREAGRPLRGEHADEPAVRGATTSSGSSPGGRRAAGTSASSSSSDRIRATTRCEERFAAAFDRPGLRRAGRELHRPRRSRHAAPARRLRGRERRHDPPRRASPTTGRRSASRSTRVRRPASAGPTSTSAGRTTAS